MAALGNNPQPQQVVALSEETETAKGVSHGVSGATSPKCLAELLRHSRNKESGKMICAWHKKSAPQ
jgi:hypothetical protein